MSEARDLGDASVNRFTFYDHTKIYTAAPPDVLRVDEKHLREHYVFNVLGFIITTNHKTDGIYLPRRRSPPLRGMVQPHQGGLHAGLLETRCGAGIDDGGFEHVAAYLGELDLSGFDPKAPPPKTPAFWDIVNANHAPEDAELADVIDAIGNPDALTVKQLIAAATGAIGGVADGSQEPARPSASARAVRLCLGDAIPRPKTGYGKFKVYASRFTGGRTYR